MRHEYLCIGGCCDGRHVDLDLSVAINGLIAIGSMRSATVHFATGSGHHVSGAVQHDYYRVGKLEIDDCIFRVMILGSMSTADAITQLINGYKV